MKKGAWSRVSVFILFLKGKGRGESKGDFSLDGDGIFTSILCKLGKGQTNILLLWYKAIYCMNFIDKIQENIYLLATKNVLNCLGWVSALYAGIEDD